MRELAELRLTNDKHAGYKGNYNLVKERIETLYNLGYIYNPYKDKFWNPFSDTFFYSNDIYNSESNDLQNEHKKKLISRGSLSKNMTEVRTTIKNKYNVIIAFFFKLGPILGILFMISSLFAFFYSSILITITFSILSIISLNTYSTKYTVKTKFEQSDFSLPIFWKRFSSLIMVIAFLNYGLFIWYLSVQLGSLWKPILIVFLSIYIISMLAKTNLSQEYWRDSGIFDIKDYAEKNNIL